MNTLAADVRSAKIGGAQPGATIPALPTHELLEEASELLEALGGSLGVLAGYLERIDNIGTDTPLAVYAAGHTVVQVRKLITASIGRVMVNEQAAR